MIHIKLMKIKTQSYDELPLDERQKAEFPATSPFRVEAELVEEVSRVLILDHLNP
jgi:hypothetical protein